MDELPVETDPRDSSAGAEIDRCAQCAGLFLEFFDGEPSAISRGVRTRGDVAHTGHAPRPGDALTCPDCGTHMTRRPYLDSGPALARCETCLAVFLTPSEVEELARLALSPEPVEEPSWLDRLLRWLPGRPSE